MWILSRQLTCRINPDEQWNMALQCRAQPSQAKVFTVQDLLLLDFFVSITRARCLDHASRDCAWTAL